MTDLADAIEMVKFAAPFRNYPGSGGIWCGRNNNLADGNFTDWGLGRAVAEICQAVADGRLVPAVTAPQRKEDEA